MSNNTRPPQFAPALAVHLLTMAIMLASVTYSLAAFFNWWLALFAACALTFTFGAFARILTSRAPHIRWPHRVGAFAVVWILFALTGGLSYSTIYAKLFAERSAIHHFDATRVRASRQLDQVLADARAAQVAIATWAKDSRLKAAIESRPGDGGGTCPTRSGTLGKRGPITLWREAEANLASKLATDISGAVTRLEGAIGGISTVKPQSFVDVVKTTMQINAALDEAETIAHGSATRSAGESLTRQLDSLVRPPEGAPFGCGDLAREEFLRAAQGALNSLQATPSLSLVPAIDLASPQETTTRGLLRAWNASLKITTAGYAGSFADDVLMSEALRRDGLINRESLGMFIAGIVELAVLLTASLASKRGTVPYPVNPTMALAAWERFGAQRSDGQRILHGFLIATTKALFNLLFAIRSPNQDDTRSVSWRPTTLNLADDPSCPPRELEWGAGLPPYLFHYNDVDYVIVPQERAPRISTAIRALSYRGAAKFIGCNVPWQVVSQLHDVTRRMVRLVPDARQALYEVFELEPAFAQALRIHLLGGPQAS